MSSRVVSATVQESEVGERLDVWLAKIPEIGSRSQALKFIENHNVRVSGVLPLKVKGSYRVRGNETIEVEIPEPKQSRFAPEDIPIHIYYQDNDIAVVEKPAGLVTHPGAGHPSGTLVNALLFHIKDLSDIGGEERPGLVHRLDKDTSGTLIVAKGNKPHQILSQMFKNHEVEREYWALVAGVPAKKAGIISSNLARHPVYRMAFKSQEHGKHAVTHFEVTEAFGNMASLVKLKLETGRTHQIRVHMSELGHPVLGDKIYGIKKQNHWVRNKEIYSAIQKMNRHALHAARLAFTHPRTKVPMSFDSPWPTELENLYQLLKKVKMAPSK